MKTLGRLPLPGPKASPPDFQPPIRSCLVSFCPSSPRRLLNLPASVPTLAICMLCLLPDPMNSLICLPTPLIRLGFLYNIFIPR